MLRRFIQILIIIVILVVGGGVAVLLQLTKPEAEKARVREKVETVEVMRAKTETVDNLRLPSQGIVESAKSSQLAAEVAGKVIEVSPKFKAGGTFEEGEVLLRIDPADYEAQVATEESRLREAELNLEMEQAQAEQAKRDWRKLGLSGEADPLALRVPQVEAAKAAVAAAEAALERARRDLDRCTISAPYPARIRRIHTEIGSYLAPSAPVADVYGTSTYEIRLPLSLDDLAYVAPTENGEGPAVWLEVEAGGQKFEWNAEVVRREGEVDRESRSVYLVAEIEGEAAERGLLQPGLFVKAEVEGQTLEDVVRVPLKAFYDMDRLVVVNGQNEPVLRKVTVLRRLGDQAIVSDGLEEGDLISLTTLDAVVKGMKVETRQVEPEAAGAELTSIEDKPKT